MQKLCEEAGAALLFNPEAEEMYFEDRTTFVTMDGLTKECAENQDQFISVECAR